MLTIVVEGPTDLPLARVLARDAGFSETLELIAGGKDAIDTNLPRYFEAARIMPWLILRDLDTAALCAGQFLANNPLKPPSFGVFRLAVRAIESWILADHLAIAEALQIAAARVPLRPDLERNPKLTLMNLARRSRRRVVKQLLVPRTGDARAVGPGYRAWIDTFIQTMWSLDRASQRSESLARARRALKTMHRVWKSHLLPAS